MERWPQRPITYREYINDQLPKEYTWASLSDSQKMMAKFVHPSIEDDYKNAMEYEKLVKRDSNGYIIVEDPKDKQIQILMEHMTALTLQLNALTKQVNPDPKQS